MNYVPQTWWHSAVCRLHNFCFESTAYPIFLSGLSALFLLGLLNGWAPMQLNLLLYTLCEKKQIWHSRLYSPFHTVTWDWTDPWDIWEIKFITERIVNTPIAPFFLKNFFQASRETKSYFKANHRHRKLFYDREIYKTFVNLLKVLKSPWSEGGLTYWEKSGKLCRISNTIKIRVPSIGFPDVQQYSNPGIFRCACRACIWICWCWSNCEWGDDCRRKNAVLSNLNSTASWLLTSCQGLGSRFLGPRHTLCVLTSIISKDIFTSPPPKGKHFTVPFKQTKDHTYTKDSTRSPRYSRTIYQFSI